MGYIQGEGRQQSSLFPVALEDLIPGRAVRAQRRRVGIVAQFFRQARQARQAQLAHAVAGLVGQGAGQPGFADAGDQIETVA